MTEISLYDVLYLLKNGWELVDGGLQRGQYRREIHECVFGVDFATAVQDGKFTDFGEKLFAILERYENKKWNAKALYNERLREIAVCIQAERSKLYMQLRLEEIDEN